MDQLKMTDWIQSRNNGLALGTDSHNSGRKIGKRAVSDAFADDWGLYENSRRGRKPLGPLSVASNVAGRVSAAAQPAGERNRQRQSSDTPFRIGGPGSSGVADDRLSPQLVQSCKDMRTNIPAPTVALPDDCQKVLSEEQQQVVMSVLSGYSTFFTGPAGSGKSHVLSTILRLNDEGNLAPTKRIVITATTGIAACSIGGVTIHSFAGIGTGDGRLEDMTSRVMGNEYARKRWREVDVLVIDEISMMPASFLDTLNFIASRARNDRRPFGGLQLVMCGDFFQLPPINLSTGFAFEAKCWSEVVRCSIVLQQIFRQNGDKQLMKVLDEARIGELSESSVQLLRTHSVLGPTRMCNAQHSESSNGGGEEMVKPTLLECRNKQVDEANMREMRKLRGEERVFLAKDKAVSRAHEAQLRQCSAQEKLSLKIGAQVILLKNLDPENGLVNGTRGVVVDFCKPSAKKKELDSSSGNEIPKEFRNLDLPVVQFDAICSSDSGNSKGNGRGLKQIVEPAEWTNKVGKSTVSSRVQIPLRLAWSLSVHKSQGMTIPNLAVSLRGVFEYGQAYVALSRATELSLLTLRGFDERCFKAHPRVKAFYCALQGSNTIAIPGENFSPGGSKVFEEPQHPGKDRNVQSITPEQQRMIEVNRRRALNIRRAKQARSHP